MNATVDGESADCQTWLAHWTTPPGVSDPRFLKEEGRPVTADDDLPALLEWRHARVAETDRRRAWGIAVATRDEAKHAAVLGIRTAEVADTTAYLGRVLSATRSDDSAGHKAAAISELSLTRSPLLLDDSEWQKGVSDPELVNSKIDI